MHFIAGTAGRDREIVALFKAVFTASEGPEEGAVIGAFVERLLADTPPDDIRFFSAWDDEARTAGPVGGIAFTRLRYAGDPRTVFILSPMAVATDRQGTGIGQALIRHGLDALRAERIDIAITYGDPAFYGRVGFQPLLPETAPPPLPLNYPQGWIGQSLTEAPLTPLAGPCTCVSALNDPTLW